MFKPFLLKSQTYRAAIFGLALTATFAASAPDLYAKEPISVVVDRAKLVRIDAAAHTVIVGNPAIADATVYDAKTLVITGRPTGRRTSSC